MKKTVSTVIVPPAAGKQNPAGHPRPENSCVPGCDLDLEMAAQEQFRRQRRLRQAENHGLFPDEEDGPNP